MAVAGALEPATGVVPDVIDEADKPPLHAPTISAPMSSGASLHVPRNVAKLLFGAIHSFRPRIQSAKRAIPGRMRRLGGERVDDDAGWAQVSKKGAAESVGGGSTRGHLEAALLRGCTGRAS